SCRAISKYAQRRGQQFCFCSRSSVGRVTPCAPFGVNADGRAEDCVLYLFAFSAFERLATLRAWICPSAKSSAVISLQNSVAVLSSRGFSSSVGALSGFQNFVSAFSYFRTVNMPVAR